MIRTSEKIREELEDSFRDWDHDDFEEWEQFGDNQLIIMEDKIDQYLLEDILMFGQRHDRTNLFIVNIYDRWCVFTGESEEEVIEKNRNYVERLRKEESDKVRRDLGAEDVPTDLEEEDLREQFRGLAK
jgi:hypothetical protein